MSEPLQGPILVDLSTMTLGEMAVVEVLARRSIEELFGTGRSKMEALACLGTVVARRTRPETTLQEVQNLGWDAVRFADASGESLGSGD